MAYSNSTITQNPLEEEKRIKLHNGDVVVHPLHLNKEEVININSINDFEGAYAEVGATIVYVINGELFITPNTKKTIKLLKNAGFKQKAIYVPLFNSASYPKKYETEWKRLMKEARFKM
ncbi:MAG: hypothetical protein ACI4UX_02345 [Clostridia bacterium]